MNRRKNRKREPTFLHLFVVSAFFRGQPHLSRHPLKLKCSNESPQKNAKTAKENRLFYISL